MSAILSADDLNDFISPGVACIKPVETLPAQAPLPKDTYEVTTEDQLQVEAPPAQISLTDCLACSGCISSAEAVLISLQSHQEVLNALDACSSIPLNGGERLLRNGGAIQSFENTEESIGQPKIFVASVSPQVRASLAATYGTTEQEAGWMIDQLLSGPDGLATGGKYGNNFSLVVDTNAMREVALVMGAEEISGLTGTDASTPAKKPILTSACPGWVCYVEKTHHHILPHLSRIKSPQALTGTLLKTILSKSFGISPGQIWHLAVMPCFDKKLEASRSELTDASWQDEAISDVNQTAIRDVDCVITAREILMLADSRGISFPNLSKKPLRVDTSEVLPDGAVAEFLFPSDRHSHRSRKQRPEAGTSGGFLYHALRAKQLANPGSEIRSQRGRNADVVEYTVTNGDDILFRAARYYGFRNIQNLVRKLRPPRESKLGRKATVAKPSLASKVGSNEYAYVEVMACPGGCTNGGGQIKINDLSSLQGRDFDSKSQKDWLALVDEAYYSMDESRGDSDSEHAEAHSEERDVIDGVSASRVKKVLRYWQELTGVDLDKLICTSFREVHSDVGKPKKSDVEYTEVAARIGSNW